MAPQVCWAVSLAGVKPWRPFHPALRRAWASVISHGILSGSKFAEKYFFKVVSVPVLSSVGWFRFVEVRMFCWFISAWSLLISAAGVALVCWSAIDHIYKLYIKSSQGKPGSLDTHLMSCFYNIHWFFHGEPRKLQWGLGAQEQLGRCQHVLHTTPSFPSFTLEFTRTFSLNFWEESKGTSAWSILCNIFPAAILSLQSNWDSLPTPMMDNSATSNIPAALTGFLEFPLPEVLGEIWNEEARFIDEKMCLKYWFHKSLSSQQIASPTMWGHRAHILPGISHSCLQHRIFLDSPCWWKGRSLMLKSEGVRHGEEHSSFTMRGILSFLQPLLC